MNKLMQYIFAACEHSSTSYVCDINQEVPVPHITNQSTGYRILNISRLILRCDLTAVAVPMPTYSWMKDGLTVVRNAAESDPVIIDDEFVTAGNNSFLFSAFPIPITVTHSRIFVDFNSSLPEAVEMEGLQKLVLDSILGEWSCNVSNVFGSASGESTVFSEYKL